MTTPSTWFVTMLPGPMVVSHRVERRRAMPRPDVRDRRAVERDADAVARDHGAARERALDDDAAARAGVADDVVGDDRVVARRRRRGCRGRCCRRTTARALPVRSVPMKLPTTWLPTVVVWWTISMPSVPLPGEDVALQRAGAADDVVRAPWSTSMPCVRLPSRRVPSGERPTMLLRTMLRVVPSPMRWTPLRWLPEMTLRPASVSSPIRLSCAPCRRSDMPPSAVSTNADCGVGRRPGRCR